MLSFFYGLVADQAEQILEDNPDMADFFAQLGVSSVTDAFLSTAMLIMALFATGFTVSSVLRLRSEELSGRVDPLLAAPVSRRRWASSHLSVALLGTVRAGARVRGRDGCGDRAGAGRRRAASAELTAAALVMVPAMWVLAGATLLLHGLRPRWSVAAWALVAWVFVAALFGSILDLPQWLLNLSPFQHVPALPAASDDVAAARDALSCSRLCWSLPASLRSTAATSPDRTTWDLGAGMDEDVGIATPQAGIFALGTRTHHHLAAAATA